jgi:pilus assembly protein TadC
VREVLAPLAKEIGDRGAALFGVAEPLAMRLRRVHSPLDPAAFRLRQMAFAGGCLIIGLTIVSIGPVPVPLAILTVSGLPVLAFLVAEQRLARASERWQRDLAYEMPIVSEQLAMLLNSGYSLGSALSRVGRRSSGCTARDLERVRNRIRQGLSDAAALQEWAEVAKVDAVDRLVNVLTLHHDSADLGRLVSAEARHARRDLHRRTIEAIERRAQQVWVPVTVATLVPGVILLAVPFLAALRLFSNA